MVKSIPPAYRRTVMLLLAYSFASAGAYVTARAVADGLFLSHIGPVRLPLIFLVSTPTVVLFSILQARLALRFRLHDLVLVGHALLAMMFLLLPRLADWYPDSLAIFGLVYVMAEVRGAVGTMHMVTLINEKFENEQPHAFVGWIGLGGTVAGAVMGGLTGVLVDYIESEHLLYLVPVMDLLAMLPITILRADAAKRGATNLKQEGHVPRYSQGDLRQAARSKQVWGIAAIMTLAVLVATLIEFQWKYATAGALHRNEHDLTRYFGYYYSGLFICTGLLQIFATGKLLERAPVAAGLALLPFCLLLTSVGVVLAVTERALLITMTLVKGCDTFKRGLHDPSVQLLYSHIPLGLRRQAIALVTGIVKPIAESAVALTLLLMTPMLSTQHLSLIAIVLICIWLLAINGLRKQILPVEPVEAEFAHARLPVVEPEPDR